MSAAWRAMRPDEYLAWEAQQELPYEYDGLRPVAMTGAREAHEDIVVNLVTALRTRLRDGACRVYAGNTKVAADKSFRYPDALIVCGPRDPSRMIVDDPVVVFEVLSEPAGGTDRIVKRQDYRNTPSIQRYIILEQTVVGAEVITRESGDWVGRSQGAGTILAIPEAGIDVPLDELYAGLDLSAIAGEQGWAPRCNRA